MTTSLTIGQNRSLVLARAILVYGEVRDNNTLDPNGAAVATVHDVARTNDECVLMPGRCVETEEIVALSYSLLGGGDKLSFIPSNVLAASPLKVVWHVPPSIQELWFQPAHLTDDEKKKGLDLKKISGELFPHPHLLFVWGQGLRVYALRCKGRPEPSTKLYVAPYWNMSEDGRMCEGDMDIPHTVSVNGIEAVQKSFFKSRFTHSNVHGSKHVHFTGGHNALWASLVNKKRFPNQVLVDSKKTISKILA